MFPVNQIMLTGEVIPGTIRGFQNAAGVYSCTFKLRTREQWSRGEHLELFSIVVRDFSESKDASRCAELKPFDRVAVQGKLRCRTRRLGTKLETIYEVYADGVEFLQPLLPGAAEAVQSECSDAEGILMQSSQEIPITDGTPFEQEITIRESL